MKKISYINLIVGLCLLLVAPSAFSVNVDLDFPTGNEFVLISSEVYQDQDINSVPKDTRPLTSSYSDLLNYDVTDVKADDVIVVRATISATHEPLNSATTTSKLSAYLQCDDKRISPYRVKTLKRQDGNHHGAMVASGFCRVIANDSNVNIALKVKSSDNPSFLSLKRYSMLVVEHYRKKTELDNESYHLPESKLQGIPVTSGPISQNGSILEVETSSACAATDHDLMVAQVTLDPDDVVLWNAHASGENPGNPDFPTPLFGFKLHNPNGSDASLAVENLTKSQLYRLSQYGYGRYKNVTSGQQGILRTFKTRVYTKHQSCGKPNYSGLPNFNARFSLASLEGLIFKKNESTSTSPDGKYLTKIYRDHAVNDQTTNVHYEEVDIGRRVHEFYFDPDGGFLRIKMHAHLKYTGNSVRACYARIEVTDESNSTAVSSKNAARYLKAPYVDGNLSAEFIYQVPSGGGAHDKYIVRPYVKCSKTASSSTNASEAVTIENTGTWMFVEKFGAGTPPPPSN